MSHSRRKLNLLGQRFGKLTVIAPAENLGSCTAWWCQCDCGQALVVRTSSLRSGRRTSCGCDLEPTPLHLHYVDGTCVEMIQNQKVRRNNTSGCTGVDWVASKRRWRATICFQGTRHYLGCYRRLEDAIAARKQAEAVYHEPFLDQQA